MTDADRNRALCEWAGIPAACKPSELQTAAAHFMRRPTPPPAVPRYPDLATREGFWPLWDALKAKGYLMTILDLGDEGIEAITRLNKTWGPNVWARMPTQWAALFEAAWALYQKEHRTCS